MNSTRWAVKQTPATRTKSSGEWRLTAMARAQTPSRRRCQFARYLRGFISDFYPRQYNEVTGQPFVLSQLVEEFINLIEE